VGANGRPTAGCRKENDAISNQQAEQNKKSFNEPFAKTR
jgi:hypothetical protein